MARKSSPDQEAMFQKIMPSASATSPPESSSLPFQPEGDSITSSTPKLKNILAGENDVLMYNMQPLLLVNIIEQMVVARLDTALSKFNCCRCDRCRKDVAALALNKLSPRYVVTEENDLEKYRSQVRSSDVTAAIIQAILQVRSHPRH